MEDRKWYLEEVADSIRDYLADDYSFNWEEWKGDSVEHLKRYLMNDATLRCDATGEGNGAYYSNTCDAREAVQEHGWAVLDEMRQEEILSAETIGYLACRSEWDRLDMEIRSYLFPYAIELITDEIEEHLAELEDEEDEE